MRIAILTLPLHTNYGGILQAFALQKVLEGLGHKVTIIDPIGKIRTHRPIVMPFVYVKRAMRKIFLNEDTSIFYNEYTRPRQKTDRFIKRYINYVHFDSWDYLEDKFDVLVVGSDQIWRREYVSWCIGTENAFLSFAKTWDVKRIAYAASFGVDWWDFSSHDTKKLKDLIKLFDAVSVREQSGVRLCENNLSVSPTVVLDPTMLLSKSVYLGLLPKSAFKASSSHIVSYILDPSDKSDDILSVLEQRFGMPIVISNSKVEQPSAPPSQRIQPPVESWISSIAAAEFVITDSFHACIFSILFHKQFAVMSNYGRGNTRIDSLLSLFGLNDRIVHDRDDALFVTTVKVDYSRIDAQIEDLRSRSLSFIESSINGK